MDALLSRGFKRLTTYDWYKHVGEHKLLVNVNNGLILVNGKHFGYVMTLRDLDDIIRVWERTDCGDELLNSLIRKQREDNEQLAKDKQSTVSEKQSDEIDNLIKEVANDTNQRPTSETTDGPRT